MIYLHFWFKFKQNLPYYNDPEFNHEKNPLHVAFNDKKIWNGKKILLNTSDIDINTQNSINRTLLHKSIINDNYELVEILLKKKKHSDIKLLIWKDINGSTPLYDLFLYGAQWTK